MWVSANGTTSTPITKEQVSETNGVQEQKQEVSGDACEVGASTSGGPAQSESDIEEVEKSSESNGVTELDAGTHLGFEDLEQLMNEIGNMLWKLEINAWFPEEGNGCKVGYENGNHVWWQ